MVHKNSVSIATTGNVIRPVDASYWNLFFVWIILRHVSLQEIHHTDYTGYFS